MTHNERTQFALPVLSCHQARHKNMSDCHSSVQLTFLAGWGGGLSSAVILARPDALPINMFAKRHDVMIVTIWWLANHFPGQVPGRLLRWKPVQIAAAMLRDIARAATMVKVINLTAQVHPDATVAVVIMGALPSSTVAVCRLRSLLYMIWRQVSLVPSLTDSSLSHVTLPLPSSLHVCDRKPPLRRAASRAGCIAGSAGKVWHDIVRGGYHIARAPDEVSVPGLGLHSAAAGAALVYGLGVAYPILNPRQCHALVALLFVRLSFPRVVCFALALLMFSKPLLNELLRVGHAQFQNEWLEILGRLPIFTGYQTRPRCCGPRCPSTWRSGSFASAFLVLC